MRSVASASHRFDQRCSENGDRGGIDSVAALIPSTVSVGVAILLPRTCVFWHWYQKIVSCRSVLPLLRWRQMPPVSCVGR